ncbi:MAG: hypothetical protein ACYCT1_08460 [Steroidobacteraceae bacterium]
MPAVVQSYLLNLVYLGALAAIGAVAPKAIAWFRAHTTAKQRAILAGLADAVVPWLEKEYPALPGADQFNQGVSTVLTWLRARGITIHRTEVAAEIQRAYAQAKANGVLAAAKAPAPAQLAAKATG